MAYEKSTKYVYEGKEYTLAELCHNFGIRYNCVWRRLKKGMDITAAITECVNDPHTWGETYGDAYMETYKTEYKGRKWKS